jgi:translocation and assembly module TamB
VSKKVKYSLLSVSFIAVVLIAAAVWLLGTSGGVRLIFSSISERSAIKVSADVIEGSLWGELGLENLQIRWPHGSVTAENFHVRWQPLSLIVAQVYVNELNLRQVHIQDNRPEKPVDLEWPSIPVFSSLLSCKIKALDIKGLVYKRFDQAPLKVIEVSSGARWDKGILNLTDFSFSTPSMSVKGKSSAGFVHPSLNADLIVELTKPIQRMSRLLLKADLKAASAPVQVEGPVKITSISVEKGKVDLSTELSIERKALILKKLLLLRTGVSGTVTGDGKILLTAAGPEFEGKLGIERLDLSQEFSAKTDLSGQIHLKGNIKSYRGELSVINKGEKWRSADIAGYFEGNREGVRLEIEKGLLLDGNMSGILQVNWNKGIELKGTMRGRGFNPAIISPDWAGVVNLNVDGAIDLMREEPNKGYLKVHLLRSSLHDRTLAGDLSATFNGRDITIADLFLKGRGFDLYAKGELQKRLAFSADITNFSYLIPDSKGALKAAGWMKIEEGRFSGSVSGKARNIAFRDMKMKGLDLMAGLSDEKGQPVSLKADMKEFSYKKIVFDRLSSRISGSMRSHKVSLDASKKELLELHTGLEGSYKNKKWEGKMLYLKGHDASGSFLLEAPVEILFSQEEISFSHLALMGKGQERIEAAGEIRQARGFLRASLERFNLARLNQWIKDIDISGTASGNVSADLQKRNITKTNGVIAGSCIFSSAGQSVDIEKGSVKFSWDDRGLDSSLQLILTQGGLLNGKIISSLQPVAGFPISGDLKAEWKNLNVALFNPLLPEKILVSGKSDGSLSAVWRERDLISLVMNMNAAGSFTYAGQRIDVKYSSLNLNGNNRGLWASLNMEPVEGGELQCTFSFQGKPRLALPEQGEIRANLKDLDPIFFRRWTPEDIVFKGKISGQAGGKILPGGSVSLSGSIALTKGILTYHTANRLISAEMRTAEIIWTWQGETLQGDISLILAEHGSLKGHFGLPIPARIPPSQNPADPIKVDLTGKMKENGLLTSVFPGMVQESHGDFDFSMDVTGTLAVPVFAGTLRLENAGGFFPSAGIRIENVLVTGHFEKNKIAIDTLQAESGQGKINGAASFVIEKWHIKSYSGTLKGNNFRTVYLPELQAEINPQITFEGDGKKLSVRGDITVPSLLIAPANTPPSLIEPSEDVIVIDMKKEEIRKAPLKLDVEVHVTFGDGFFVRAEGIDVQLNGNIAATVHDINAIKAKGTLRVMKGTYKNYGVDLKIEKGLLLFTGGKIENPSLDVLALRSINEIRVGVLMNGTLEKPIIKLYSEPSMPDTDILAYIVLGHPLGGGSSEQASILMKAASILLSKGESTVLQNQMRRKLGLDVLDIESSGTTEGTAARSMLTLGKYLTPKLFVSYGQSLFNRGGLFKMRYGLSKHFEVESQSGVESGIDFIYKIDLK